MIPTGALAVTPSRVQIGEPFYVRIKLRGEVVEPKLADCCLRRKPNVQSQFNLATRGLRFLDDTLPEWTGALEVDDDPALDGPRTLTFDGKDQGAYPGDPRPIRSFGPFRWTAAGMHFLRFTDPAGGFTASANAMDVSEDPPARRVYWGDPHWQSFFSDGLRCPEELYWFARDEAFLDWGALSDHSEPLTDWQWDYFMAVTNAFNEPGRFPTLVGQEWTSHNWPDGAGNFGHRNIYFRGDDGPILRSRDPGADTLDKLWDKLRGVEALVIPHHTASAPLGADWSHGWNPQFEKAVEIYSVWGNSECPAEQGNPRPIRFNRGERAGRHVVDALNRGYRFGFVGGGDIHDGRPGDDLTSEQGRYFELFGMMHPQGFTAAVVPALTREAVYDAIQTHRTYATTRRRIYLDATFDNAAGKSTLTVRAASEDGVREAALVRGGERALTLTPDEDPRVVQATRDIEPLGPDEWAYVRVLTATGDMAWSSPVWGGT